MGNDISTSNVNVVNSHITKITKTYTNNTNYPSTQPASKPIEIQPASPTMEMASYLVGKRYISLESEFNSNSVRPLELISRIKLQPSAPNFTGVTTGDKVCFICCNSYENTRYALGESAINDGLLSFIKLEKLGYKPFMFHDIRKREFVNLFKSFLSLEVSKFLLYFIGHGTSTIDHDNDEADGRDECLFFMDGTIVDDELYRLITAHKHSKSKLVLISDCCHSGTIFDVPDRVDILTISAAADNETAKQDWIERKGHGLFTYYLWKYYNPSMKLGALQNQMNKHLKPYTQGFITNRTDMGLSDLL